MSTSRQLVDRVDSNKDGRITADEFGAFLKSVLTRAQGLDRSSPQGRGDGSAAFDLDRQQRAVPRDERDRRVLLGAGSEQLTTAIVSIDDLIRRYSKRGQDKEHEARRTRHAPLFRPARPDLVCGSLWRSGCRAWG
jgi:hypothetical protein